METRYYVNNANCLGLDSHSISWWNQPLTVNVHVLFSYIDCFMCICIGSYFLLK